MSVALSVVIPTRDRVARLEETLAALTDEAKQHPPAGGFEVIVVDDGSAEPLSISGSEPERGFQLHLLAQPPRGPAAARNLGIRHARGERILLLGDDTRPAPGTLRQHLDLAAEQAAPVAIQGHIDWDPHAEITPLMEFLAPAGPQFYFRGLEANQPVPFTAVLGSNFSAPRTWWLTEPFDEGFPYAAVEDTELAWRWSRRGWAAIYGRDAVCWHHHHYAELDRFLERQRRAGISARYAVRRHPRLWWPLVLKPTVFTAIIHLRRLLGRPQPHAAWDLACRRAFWRGVTGRG